LDVVARAHDVPVAAQHIVAAAGEPLVEDRLQSFHRLELELLAFLSGRTGRYIKRYDAELAVARLEVAALFIERLPAERRAHLVRLAPRIDRDAAVALLRDRVTIVAMVAVRTERRIGQLVLLRFGFLQADDVGALLPQPVEEPLAGGRANAVGIEADDAH